MKIAVLIKQVPGSDSALPLNGDGSWIDDGLVNFVMNESDNYALEEGLQIREKIGDGEVVIVSMGPERVQRVIREGLAKGADRGIYLEESGQSETDPLCIAKSFALVLKDESFDLILTGLQSDDTGMGQTGVLLGELLGMSTATLGIETDILSDTIRVKRELESGWFQWVKLPLPASVSIQSGINQPRYPSLKGIMGAKKKDVKIVTGSDHLTDTKWQSLDRLFIPMADKQTEMIEGDADTVVARLVEILRSDLRII